MSERDEILARAVWAWEGSICDLRDMSGVATAILDEALSGAPDKEGRLSVSPDSVRHILFCAYGLEKMIDELYARYYAAIEAKR